MRLPSALGFFNTQFLRLAPAGLVNPQGQFRIGAFVAANTKFS
jgi:hypothetical protein